MKRSKYSETQIVAILKEGEAGRAVAEICREHGISNATYYQWKSKYGGLEVWKILRKKSDKAANSFSMTEALDLLVLVESQFSIGPSSLGSR